MISSIVVYDLRSGKQPFIGSRHVGRSLYPKFRAIPPIKNFSATSQRRTVKQKPLDLRPVGRAVLGHVTLLLGSVGVKSRNKNKLAIFTRLR